jgi:hypothetical protein
MDTKTQYDLILEAIMSKGKPLQKKEILATIESTGFRLPYNQLGVVLDRSVKKGMLGKIKFPGLPFFYVHPKWIESGKLKKEFDPYTKQFVE